MLPFETKEVLLKVESLSKSYDVPILKDINIEIHNLTRPDITQGQIVSLIGKSGSGKSTLFRIMAGLEKPNTGSVKLLDSCDGIDNYWPVEEGQMGVVFQNSYVYPWRKVRKILDMAVSKNPELNKYNSRADRNCVSDGMVEQLATLLNLEDHLNKYSCQLSGGQRQRVAIAEQVLSGGDFILMDEPFSGLDTLTIDKVTETLTKIALTNERKTIIIVSHDLSNCLAISDTAFILSPQEGGSTITHKIDLATQGLAWQPGIKENPMFRDLLNQVKSLL